MRTNRLIIVSLIFGLTPALIIQLSLDSGWPDLVWHTLLLGGLKFAFDWSVETSTTTMELYFRDREQFLRDLIGTAHIIDHKPQCQMDNHFFFYKSWFGARSELHVEMGDQKCKLTIASVHKQKILRYLKPYQQLRYLEKDSKESAQIS